MLVFGPIQAEGLGTQGNQSAGEAVNYMLFLMPRFRGSCPNPPRVCANHMYKPRIWDEAGTELTTNAFFGDRNNFVYSDIRNAGENALDRWSRSQYAVFWQCNNDFLQTNAAAEREEIQTWFILKLPQRDKYIIKRRSWGFLFHEGTPNTMANPTAKKWIGGGVPPIFTKGLEDSKSCYFGYPTSNEPFKGTKAMKDKGDFDQGWAESGTIDFSQAGNHNMERPSFLQSNASFATEEELGWYHDKGCPEADTTLDASMTGGGRLCKSPCHGVPVTDPVKSCHEATDEESCDTTYTSAIPGCAKCGWVDGNCLTAGPFCSE